MIHTFLKPKVKNIWQETWNKVSSEWFFWVPIIFFFFFGFIVLIIPFLYFLFELNKMRATFWKEFADLNGWKYKENHEGEIPDLFSSNSNNEQGIMFKEGSMGNISNEIDGIIDNRHFRIFCYQFSVGSGKSKKTYYYTVFAFSFNGSFPHIYLNNKNNSWGIHLEEKIPLPLEFEKKFSLHAPKKYEIEALEIFTPELLVKLLDLNFPYDVEFVNQEILIFTDGQINDFPQLENKFNKAFELKDLIDTKLDKFQFKQIGNIPYTLNNN